MKFKSTVFILTIAGTFATMALPASAQDFYKGKTISIVVGFSPGGTYDITARLLARHLGDHIPGKPSVIVQTMTGAGGSTAVMHLYNGALRDGTEIGMPPRNFPVAPFVNEELRYDGSKFIPLGSTSTEVQVGAVWNSVGVTNFNQLMTREISAGVTSYTDDIGLLTQVTKVVTGAKLKVVNGYPGGNDITTAMERGEVDSEFGWSWGSVKTRARAWVDAKKINIVFQLGAEKAPDLPNVPFIMDYAKNDLDRRALELLLAPDAFAWPFVAPPGVPAARVAILRQAFAETMTDPGFLDDAKKANVEINPISGETIQERIGHIFSFDSSVTARAKEIVKPPM